jgi:CheY-like chemotaxis protein
MSERSWPSVFLHGQWDGGLQVMAAAGVLSPGATVIALTGYPEDHRYASLRLGATHFLEKPVSLDTLAERAASAGVPTAIQPALPALAAGGVGAG